MTKSEKGWAGTQLVEEHGTPNITCSASEGHCPENESQLFSIFYEENSKAGGLMPLHRGIRVAKKELPLGR